MAGVDDRFSGWLDFENRWARSHTFEIPATKDFNIEHLDRRYREHRDQQGFIAELFVLYAWGALMAGTEYEGTKLDASTRGEDYCFKIDLLLREGKGPFGTEPEIAIQVKSHSHRARRRINQWIMRGDVRDPSSEAYLLTRKMETRKRLFVQVGFDADGDPCLVQVGSQERLAQAFSAGDPRASLREMGIAWGAGKYSDGNPSTVVEFAAGWIYTARKKLLPRNCRDVWVRHRGAEGI